jgi:hypothetical protein
MAKGSNARKAPSLRPQLNVTELLRTLDLQGAILSWLPASFASSSP